MNYLVEQIAKLGMSVLEAKVYLALLERQLTTAGVLAKFTGMKRSTVYTILDTLIDRGLVSVTQIDAVKHYQAEAPERIKEILDKRAMEIVAQKKILDDVLKDLNALHAKKLRPPKITIYEGQKGVDTLLMRNLDDEPKEVLVIGEHMGDRDHIPAYTQRRIKLGIPTKVICPKGGFIEKMMKLDKISQRKTYLLPKQYSFPASIHIYDQSVALFTYQGKNPVGVYIENEDIAVTVRMIFELLEKGL